MSYSVHSESINTQIEPESENIFHLFQNERISVIEIWLANNELVKVELTPLLSVLPGRVSEHTHLGKNVAFLNKNNFRVIYRMVQPNI